MNYRPKNDVVFRQFSIGLIVFIILVIARLLASSQLSYFFTTIAQPFWNARDHVFGQTETISGYADSKSSLLSQITELKDELYSLQIKNLALSVQASSSPQINTKSSKNEGEFISAKVILKPPYTPFDVLLLNKGTTSGIQTDDMVFIQDDILIGKISSSIPNQSNVLLFSAGSQTYPANVLRTKDPITLIGKGNGNFEMTEPKDFNIIVGDYLVDMSSSQSLLAVVYAIDSSSQGSFKTVYARIPFNILESDLVTVKH